jgi:hypothetical protein
MCFQKALLDILFIIFKDNIYNIIRFQCADETSIDSFPLAKCLVDLLDRCIAHDAQLSILKRIIHLIGIVATAGIEPADLLSFLSILKKPSELTVSLLQAFKIMIGQDQLTKSVMMKKASPTAVFDFGGSGSGLTTNYSQVPFTREYQFCTWFRIESFETPSTGPPLLPTGHDALDHQQKAFNPSFSNVQHIITWQNSARKGMDIFIDRKVLVIAISHQSRPENTIIQLTDYPLQSGIWYHLHVKHSKPRLSIFASDELTVFLDQQTVFSDNIRFPNLGNFPETKFVFGSNFDGQMTAIYLFAESVALPIVDTIARIDGGKPVEGFEYSVNPIVVDLLQSISSADRKSHSPIMSKVSMTFHPSRCMRNHALEIHTGRHAKLGQRTHPWMVSNARDLLASIGGLSALFPLFPRLLIENELCKTTTTTSEQHVQNNNVMVNSNQTDTIQGSSELDPNINDILPMKKSFVVFTGLGNSLAEFTDDSQSDRDSSDLDYSFMALLRSEKEDCIGERCIGLLLSIIAKCIVAHKPYQLELLNSGGVEMIEYALTCVPQEILQAEGEMCVVSLIQLQTASSEVPALEYRIKKSLLCNFSIWHRASFQLVSSLMSFLLATIKSEPSQFTGMLGSKFLINSLEYFADINTNSGEYYYFSNPQQPKNKASSKKGDEMVIQDTDNPPTDINQHKSEKFLTIQTSNLVANNSKIIINGTEQTVHAVERSHHYECSTISPTDKFSPDKDKEDASKQLLSANHDGVIDDASGAPAADPTEDSHRSVSYLSDIDAVTLPSGSSSRPRMNTKKGKSFKVALTEVIQTPDYGNDESRHPSIHHPDDPANTDRRMNSLPMALDVSSLDIVNDNSSIVHNNSEADLLSNSSFESRHDTFPSTMKDHPTIDDRNGEGGGGRASTVESNQHTEENFTPAPQTNDQRKYLRDCLEAMIVAIVLQDGTEKELAPVLDYILIAKDLVLANEIAQILLYLIIEGGSRFISAIISVCSGPEEFASYVLLYVIHKPYEELRCTGIRILSHFYLRLDQANAPLLSTALKQRRKQQSLYQSMSNIAAQVASRDQGLQRLQLCGGLALLVEILSSHCKVSTELTYSALLELLLTKPGGKSQVTVQYTDLFDTSGATSTTIFASNTNNSSTNISSAGGGSVSQTLPLRVVGATGSVRPIAQHKVVFAAAYLSPDQVHEEDVDMMNAAALPIFFELLPKLPMSVQGQIYSDLLALLKHSESNCHAFICTSSWHLCMFGMVSQLVLEEVIDDSIPTITTISILGELEKWTGYNIGTEFNASFFVSSKYFGSVAHSLSNGKGQTSPKPYPESRLARGYSIHGEVMLLTRDAASNAFILPPRVSNDNDMMIASTTTSDNDMWFALGMKVYATLLLHAMEFKNGWKELDRSISQSYECGIGYSVAQTILSHVLNEITFTMRSKYRELQRLAKSKDFSENQEATDRIENLLCLLLTSSEVALIDFQCAVTGIKDFHLCKLRVHVFSEICHEYAMIKDTSTHPTDLNKANFSGNQIDGLLPASDIRSILEKTEVSLSTNASLVEQSSPTSSVVYDIYGARRNTDSSFPSLMDQEHHQYQKYLDFSHEWHDLVGVASQSDLPSSSSANNNTNNDDAGGQNNPTFQYKSIEELLHPLERNHDVSNGKLVLVLQSLRFFDVIFWPSNTGALRNAEMLKFSKEDTNSIFISETNSISNSGNKQSEKKKPQQQQSFAPAYPLSVCSAVMRMSLFILTQLSPITHLAILNLKRMRMLINCMDKMNTSKTPTSDWLLAVVLHTTLGMQRIAHSLEPIYSMLGIKEKVYVRSVGPWLDSYDDFDRLDVQDASLFDIALDNEDAMTNLQRYFDCSPGRNLIRNLRASLMLLADAFEFHHVKLSASLEERTFRSLWVLVEHFRADCSINAMPEVVDRSSMVINEPTDRPSSIAFSLSSKLFRQGSVSVVPGSIQQSSSVDLFDSGPYSPQQSALSSSSSSSSVNSPFSPRFAKINTVRTFSRGRSVSDHSDLSADDDNNYLSPAPAPALDEKDKQRSQQRIVASPTPVPESTEETFRGHDILQVLKWLRFPYFKLNPFRNIGVIKAVDALDYLEVRSVHKFTKEIQSLKESLEEQQDLAIKSVEEMADLKELSLDVKESMLNRHETRVASEESYSALKLKNVAARWHDCLQRFEEDWSPWRNNDDAIINHEMTMMAMMIPHSGGGGEAGGGAGGGEAGGGAATHELSKHRDFFLRRMVLTKLPEPITYENAAYLEGKKKDQEQFEAHLLRGGAAVKTSSKGASGQSNANNRASLPFKNRTITEKSMQADSGNGTYNATTTNMWGDEEDDVSVEEINNNSSTVAGISGGIATLLTGGLSSDKRPSWTNMFRWASDERYLLEFEVTQIRLEQVVSGVVLLTTKCLYFHARKQISGLTNSQHLAMDQRWYLDRIVEAYGRRYLLQNCAIELFFIDSPELFLAFKSLAVLQRFFRCLRNQFIPLLTTPRSLNPRYAFENSPWTELWRRRSITNFEYLMRLNVMAGRSFNDITQYPVFPWILSDYSSDTIDLSNPNVFRKLELPIGALNPIRLQEFLDRYNNSFDDDTIPFMYGTHYSSAGVVLHYMVRQEPFSTLAINLQGGRFDCPDRVFFDMDRTWFNCNQSNSDVKEMIPELFCCPEALLNTNRLPLGNLQEEGKLVDNVVLPPWAANAFEFIRLNRAALESDYVSEHLPAWIDLIFGYKQTRPHAEAAFNVFVHLTYENAIDIESIEDPLQRAATKVVYIQLCLYT